MVPNGAALDNGKQTGIIQLSFKRASNMWAKGMWLFIGVREYYARNN